MNTTQKVILWCGIAALIVAIFAPFPSRYDEPQVRREQFVWAISLVTLGGVLTAIRNRARNE